MTTASKLTLSRIVMIPVFVLFMLLKFRGSMYIAIVIFALASITDAFDGYVARHYNQVTDFGKFLDPLADKLLVTAALLVFVWWGQMHCVWALIIIAREFAVTGLRLIAAGNGRVIAAAKLGKMKTGTSITCIVIMMLIRELQGYGIAPSALNIVNYICIGLMVVFTLVSGVEYFIKNWDVLFNKEAK